MVQEGKEFSPLTNNTMDFDQAELDRLNARRQSGRVIVNAPPEDQKLGFVSVVCLILNRTVGECLLRMSSHCSVLRKGHVKDLGYLSYRPLFWKIRTVSGISLLLWTLGAIVAFSGLLVWLELALTIPRVEVVTGQEVSVSRSGGEKNYVSMIILHASVLALTLPSSSTSIPDLDSWRRVPSRLILSSSRILQAIPWLLRFILCGPPGFQTRLTQPGELP